MDQESHKYRISQGSSSGNANDNLMNFVSVGQNLANYFLHRRFQSMIEPTMF
jgi:hypothetical protein